ncbi:hypothetical protein [Streptomyces sp. NPDC051546]|uniref:hypothetical protein n=1 Tax=Streptomyces sp. NPDC051546 TaxID=3365655 RepID=UPI003798EB7C
MSDESVITIEIRGHQAAALEASRRISDLFLSTGPCRLRRTPGEPEVQVLVYANVRQGAEEGGYEDAGAAYDTLGYDLGVVGSEGALSEIFTD